MATHVQIRVPPNLITLDSTLTLEQFNLITKDQHIAEYSCLHKCCPNCSQSASHQFKVYTGFKLDEYGDYSVRHFTYCNECVKTKNERREWYTEDDSFAIYLVESDKISLICQWGHDQIQYTPENTIDLWNNLASDPKNVRHLQALIDLYSN